MKNNYRFWWLILMAIAIDLASPRPIWAGGFNLKQIGEVSTDGKQINHWWYSGNVPIFRGEAQPNSEVAINIDGNSQIISADSSGNFDYQVPTALSEGDHQVELSSGGSTISFTLTIGSENVNWEAVDKGSGDALPAAGWPLPTFMLLISGLGLPILGRKIWR
ncbi:MAG: hypothetical protein WCT01_03100 [Candidatus Shapirobacteria bacterium]